MSSAPTGASTSQFNKPAAQRVRKINSWSSTSSRFAFSTRRTSARIPSKRAVSRSHPSGGSIPARATMRITARSEPPPGQGADHRPGEGCRQRLERGLRAYRALPPPVEHPDSAPARARPPRRTAISASQSGTADRGDVGPGQILCKLSEKAILAAFSEQVQRSAHETCTRPQAGLAALIEPGRFHRNYSIRCLDKRATATLRSGAVIRRRPRRSPRRPECPPEDDGSDDGRLIALIRDPGGVVLLLPPAWRTGAQSPLIAGDADTGVGAVQ